MSRKNIYDVIKTTDIDVGREYDRVYTLFYSEHQIKYEYMNLSFFELADKLFRRFDKSFSGRAISFIDFNATYKFSFLHPGVFAKAIRESGADAIGYFIRFAEYVYNVAYQVGQCLKFDKFNYLGDTREINYLFEFVESSINNFGYSSVKYESGFIFVETNPAAIAVSEIANDKLSFRVIEYNHHRLKGDLSAKLAILKLAADDIEPQRKILNGINKTLAENLFQMLQKFVRHNNEDNPYIKGLSKKELESCYDDIYQMWLLAKLEIDNLERKKRVEETLKQINANE